MINTNKPPAANLLNTERTKSTSLILKILASARRINKPKHFGQFSEGEMLLQDSAFHNFLKLFDEIGLEKDERCLKIWLTSLKILRKQMVCIVGKNKIETITQFSDQFVLQAIQTIEAGKSSIFNLNCSQKLRDNLSNRKLLPDHLNPLKKATNDSPSKPGMIDREKLEFKGETILFVDYALPMYDRYAGSRTNYMYLKTLLKMGLNVIYLPSDFKHIEPYSSELKALGVEVIAGTWYATNWRNWLQEKSEKIDYAFLHKPIPALKFIDYLKLLPISIPIIYQCHDLHYLRLQRQAELSGDKDLHEEAMAYKEKEDYIFDASDSILTFSTVEEGILKDRFPSKNIYTVPLYYYEAAPLPQSDFRDRNNLLFVGGFDHLPNRDAVKWFCLEVLPLILQGQPDLIFHVVGGNPPEDILNLASDNIKLLGSISDDDLASLYRNTRLVIVPLRYGAGVKGKVIESISNGIPIVSTSIGLEGIEGITDVAKQKDKPSEFADEVLRLYMNEKDWRQASSACSSLIAERLTEVKAISRISDILIQSRITGSARFESLRDSGDNLGPRLIAFYLPQYHPIPENDNWWGKGFTEWRNVCKATPLFAGHYQPHLPADLGFYDLRSSDTRIAQADLARQHGIFGFCYYHYWFMGKRLLQRPVEEILATGEPAFPFCLCWANENWTRKWDGKESQILIEQTYSEEDDRNHIRELIKYFADPRYIRIEGKPLFLVYRIKNLPDPASTSRIWREEAWNAGIGDIYLALVESIGCQNPLDAGFDASVEFAPDWNVMGSPARMATIDDHKQKKTVKIPDRIIENNYVRNYDELVTNMMSKKRPSYPWYRCITPSWDNSARRSEGGAVIQVGASPKKYQAWLKRVISETISQDRSSNSFVFINAWNEWAEGNHLEPCLKFGRQYLEATKNAIHDELGDEYFSSILKKTQEKKVLKLIGMECTFDEACSRLDHIRNHNSPEGIIISLEDFYAIGNKTYFKGWAAINDQVSTEMARISILILDKLSQPRLLFPERLRRPDITAYFGNRCNYDYCGFEALVNYTPLDSEIIIVIERDGLVYWQSHSPNQN